jgi:hypothetical protein
MTYEEIFTIISLIIASFGGGVVIIIVLSSWLGKLWMGRILQEEKASFTEQLENIRHELSITKSSYEHHIDLILDYYALFYKHYLMCSRAANADAYRPLPDGEMIHSREEYLDNLEGILKSWQAYHGRLRLLLPAKLLSIHEEAIGKLNEFRDAVYSFTSAEPEPRKKAVVFKELDEIKSRLEAGLRDFLRTEHLLK